MFLYEYIERGSMNINGNLGNSYKNYIENQNAQQAKFEASTSNITNPQFRAYLDASNKVMNQLNQMDQFVYSKTQQEQPQGFFGKAKAFIHNLFHKQ